MYQELRNVLSRGLPGYFAGAERVGVALTGGMDTRVIMAGHKSAAGSVPCYTFGGMYRECEDVRLATEGRQHLPANAPGDNSRR
jgi:asparagine synthase (glutamine-hydrolysing)